MKQWKKLLALFCAILLTITAIPTVKADYQNVEKVNKITLTQEEYEQMMAYDEAHHHETEQYNDEIYDIDARI